MSRQIALAAVAAIVLVTPGLLATPWSSTRAEDSFLLDDPFAAPPHKEARKASGTPVIPMGQPILPIGQTEFTKAGWQQKIKKVLDGQLTVPLEFIETPLQDALNILKENYSLEIQLDQPGLDEMGIPSDAPVTLNLNGISLRSALRLMLRELELTYVLKNEILLITTFDKADTELITRIYPVGDLVKVYRWQQHHVSSNGGRLSEIPVVGMTRQEDAETSRRIADHILCQFGGQMISHTNKVDDKPLVGINGLTKLVRLVVAPDSWDEVGGPGSICPFSTGLILVSQTDGVHQRIVRLLAAFRVLPPLHEQEPSKVYPNQRLDCTTEMPKRIEAALDGRLKDSLDFIETPLRDAVSILKEDYDIEIQMDMMGMDELGIASDSPVTINVSGISLRSALRLMLRDLELTYVIKDEVLLITTPDKSEAELTVKVYPVGDIVDREYGDDGQMIEIDFGSLITVIKTTIRADSWEDFGGPGSAETYLQRGLLVVMQTQETHEEIADLLARIRAVRKATGDKPTAEKPDPAEVVVRTYFFDFEQRKAIHAAIEPLVQAITSKKRADGCFALFLPARIVVRHRRDVQAKLQQLLIRELAVCSLPPSSKSKPRGGDMGGGIGGGEMHGGGGMF